MVDLFDAVVTDYQNNGRPLLRSLATLQDRLIPLKAAFGINRAIDVGCLEVPALARRGP